MMGVTQLERRVVSSGALEPRSLQRHLAHEHLSLVFTTGEASDR